MRQAAKRDGNEPAIVEALEAAGARVWRISGPGQPDLLILTPAGTWQPCEVKNPDGKNRATAAQTRESGPWPTVRSVPEALALLWGPAELTPESQEGSPEASTAPSKPRSARPGTLTPPQTSKRARGARKADRHV